MIAPDLETAVARLREMIEQFRARGSVHRRRYLDRKRYSGFPFARRPVDQDAADPVRSVPRKPRDARRGMAAALRDGGVFREGRSRLAAISRSRRSISRGKSPGVITQNIDNLHQASGIARARCDRVARQYHLRHLSRLQHALRTSWMKAKFDSAGGSAPDCDCGGYIKTATVSFGQAMPEAAMRRAQEWAGGCDLFIAIGSSLVVWPAAGFPLQAKKNGARSLSSIANRPNSIRLPILLSATTSATHSRRFIAH